MTDVLSRIRDVSLDDAADDAIQILLIGSGDIRHLLTTIARAWRHRKRKLKVSALLLAGMQTLNRIEGWEKEREGERDEEGVRGRDGKSESITWIET